MPKVSVIIPTYNRAHLIGRSVQSVLNQTYKDFEIIVVDDGSTDNTEEIVTNIDDDRINFIQHENNKGASAARNTGIKASKGEYIAFQDSDDEWMPEKLETQMDVFETKPKIDIVYTDMLRINEEGVTMYWHSPTISLGHIINDRTMDYQAMGLGIVSTLIKRECFNKVESFDEKFPRFEDLDFFIRLSKHYHFHHIKKPFVKYYATDGVSFNNKTVHIARELLLDKYLDDIGKNKIYLSKQYFLIGNALQSCGEFTDAKRYFIKAFKTTPMAIKFLPSCIFTLFDQKMYGVPGKMYQKLKNQN